MKRKLFIDTGHSPKYPGAHGIKSEVNWVRAIAEKLYPLLNTNYWEIVKVPDSYPKETSGTTLMKRIAWINERGAPGDFLLSLHANAAGNPTARGVETFYWAGMKEPEEEAKRLSKAYSLATGIPIRGGDGAKGDSESQHHTLGIIRDTKPCALLIEVGFVTNKEDCEVSETNSALGIANYLNSFSHMEEQQVQLSDKQKEAVMFIGHNKIANNLDPDLFFKPINRIDTFTLINNYHQWLLQNFDVKVK